MTNNEPQFHFQNGTVRGTPIVLIYHPEVSVLVEIGHTKQTPNCCSEAALFITHVCHHNRK